MLLNYYLHIEILEGVFYQNLIKRENSQVVTPQVPPVKSYIRDVGKNCLFKEIDLR